MSLAFSATDTGSGVYRVIVSVDGQDALGVVVDANDGRCADADATNADAHEFLLAGAVQGQRRPAAEQSTPAGCRSASTPSRSCSRTPPATARRSTGRWPRRSSRRPPAAARPTGRRPATPPASRAAATARSRPPSPTAGCASGAGSSVPTASRIAGARIDVLSQLHRAGSRFRAIGHDAHEPQGRVQLQGAAGRVADAALRLPLAPRRRCLHRRRSTCCSACARAPPCARAAGSSRAAAG